MAGKHQKKTIHTDKAPKAIGPYSPAVCAGPFVFVSGQLGLIPESGNLVEGGVEAEARQALTNLSHLLEAAGTELAQVVKTTVFLRDIADFARVNAIYAEFFTENPPARSAVQVAALPKAAAVEIEAIALCGEQCHCHDKESGECQCGCDCSDEDCKCHCHGKDCTCEGDCGEAGCKCNCHDKDSTCEGDCGEAGCKCHCHDEKEPGAGCCCK